MITHRDQAVLEALCLKIPGLAVEQIAKTWFVNGLDGAHAAQRRMRALAKKDLLELTVISAHPLLSLPSPVCSWVPGDDFPDPTSISRTLQSRWTRPLQPTAVCVPTRRALALFGRKARKLSAAQATHDIHLAEVFLHYRNQDPNLAARWTGEGLLARPAGQP